MKNKKLLSLLCLVALVGCGTTSTSSTNNQPSSPASSSTVAPSSPTSSSEESSTNSSTSSSTVVDSSSTNNSSSTVVDSSSTNNSSSTVVDSSSTNNSSSTVVDSSSTNNSSSTVETPDTADKELQKATVAIKEASTHDDDMVSFSLTKTSSGSSSVETRTVTYNSNYVLDETERINSNSSSKVQTYKIVKDNRYYVVENDVTDSTNPVVKKINGYDVVDEAVTAAEVTQEDVDANYVFSAGNVDGFGMATSYEALFEGIFENYDAEYSYDIAVEKQYTSANASNFVYSSLSYYTAPSNSYSTTIYKYCVDFEYDENGKISHVLFAQTSYYSETNVYTYYYEYTFEFGERESKDELFDLDSLMLTDYSIKLYSDYGHTTEATTTVEAGSTIYFSFEGTPDTVTGDTPILEAMTGDKVCWAYPGNSVTSMYFSSEGVATFTFVSAKGIRKSIEITVVAPAPTAIEFYGDMPSVVAVNGMESLPTCSIKPYTASQKYEWKVVEGSDYAEIVYNEEYESYSVKGLAAGTCKVQANPVADPTIVTEVYEIEICEPKSETELNSIMVDTNWAFNDGTIYTLDLNSDGTGVINFGYEKYWNANWEIVTQDVETTYTFNWTFTYSTGEFVVSNGTWNNRASEGNYASFTDPTITPSLLGDKINVRFGEYYDWSFVTPMTSEEIQTKIIETSDYSVYFNNFHYVELYVTITEDEITFFTKQWDDNWNQINVNEQSVAYTWDNDGNILLTGGDFAYTINGNYGNYDVTISQTLKVDTYFASYFEVTFTCEEGTFSGKAY